MAVQPGPHTLPASAEDLVSIKVTLTMPLLGSATSPGLVLGTAALQYSSLRSSLPGEIQLVSENPCCHKVHTDKCSEDFSSRS